ncbi:MAG TPA: twin-arginine translocase TatA/TatE family subunit [Ktedonosporobacter sp.]|jgi:Sec-independent protein translocase protein TatA|nr:twin-arginine translocase TatA/TatE family subunit [Ktedonosporobacter sp.]
MGFHLVDILIVAAIGLALFGPKALQSMARNTGRGLGQVKDVKDKFLADLPMEDISKVTEQIPKLPQIPLNSRQAIQMLVTSEIAEKKEQEAGKGEATEKPQEVKLEETH